MFTCVIRVQIEEYIASLLPREYAFICKWLIQWNWPTSLMFHVLLNILKMVCSQMRGSTTEAIVSFVRKYIPFFINNFCINYCSFQIYFHSFFVLCFLKNSGINCTNIFNIHKIFITIKHDIKKLYSYGISM